MEKRHMADTMTDTAADQAEQEISRLTGTLLAFLETASNHDPILAAAACGKAMIALCHIEGIDIDGLLDTVRAYDHQIHDGRVIHDGSRCGLSAYG